MRPLEATRASISAYTAVLSHPDVLSISIQIRTTDRMMSDVDAVLDPEVFRGFFTCAAYLASRHRKLISHSVIHLASDFAPLRRQFAENMFVLLDGWPEFLPKPQPLLTAVTAKHSSSGAGDLGTSTQAMQAAVFEQAIMCVRTGGRDLKHTGTQQTCASSRRAVGTLRCPSSDRGRTEARARPACCPRSKKAPQ